MPDSTELDERCAFVVSTPPHGAREVRADPSGAFARLRAYRARTTITLSPNPDSAAAPCMTTGTDRLHVAPCRAHCTAPRHDGSAVVSRTGASVERRCHIQAPNAAPPIAQVVRKIATSVPEPNRGRCSPGGESSIDLAIRPVHFAPHERPLQRPVAGELVPVGLSARLRQVACLILDVTKRLSLRSRRTRRSARRGDRCEGRAPRGAPTPLDAQILLLKERRQP